MASTTKTSPKKHLIINAFAMGCSGLQSQGLWKYPDDRSRYYKDIDYWVDLAKLLDNGKFNSVFLADVLVSCASSTSGVSKDFGAKHAEVIFVISFSPEDLKPKVEAIRKIAVEKCERECDAIKFVALITTAIKETKEAAKAKFEDYRQYKDLEGSQALFRGWTGINLSKYGEEESLGKVSSNSMRAAVENWSKAVSGQGEWTRKVIAKQITVGSHGPVIGTPKFVADQLEIWVDVADINGFNFTYAVTPKTFEDIVELLLPELRKRGLSWGDYAVPGGTYRENITGVAGPAGGFLRPSHHAHKYRWKAGIDRESFEESLPNSKCNSI